MAVIKAKPTSPGRRGVISIKSDLYKGRPYKALLEKKSKNGGQNLILRIIKQKIIRKKLLMPNQIK